MYSQLQKREAARQNQFSGKRGSARDIAAELLSISAVAGNRAVLQMMEGRASRPVVQRQPWQRDAGGYGGTSLHGIATGGPPQVSQSGYARTETGENFVLGWDSMVTFTAQNDGFQIGNVASDNPQYPAPQEAPRAVEAVVTRGVASCTAILVSNGNNIAMLHLDKGRLEWGLEALRRIDAEWEGGITDAFISYTDDRTPEASVRWNFVNIAFPRAFPNARLRLLDRGVLNMTNAIHSEIGLGYGDDGNFEIFGDMLSPNFTELIAPDSNPTLVEMNTRFGAGDYSRFLFRAPYDHPDIQPPALWPPLAAPPPEQEPWEREQESRVQQETGCCGCIVS